MFHHFVKKRMNTQSKFTTTFLLSSPLIVPFSFGMAYTGSDETNSCSFRFSPRKDDEHTVAKPTFPENGFMAYAYAFKRSSVHDNRGKMSDVLAKFLSFASGNYPDGVRTFWNIAPSLLLMDHRGCSNALQIALNAGMDVDAEAECEHGVSLLTYAIENRMWKPAQMLLDVGGNIDGEYMDHLGNRREGAKTPIEASMTFSQRPILDGARCKYWFDPIAANIAQHIMQESVSSARPVFASNGDRILSSVFSQISRVIFPLVVPDKDMKTFLDILEKILNAGVRPDIRCRETGVSSLLSFVSDILALWSIPEFVGNLRETAPVKRLVSICLNCGDFSGASGEDAKGNSLLHLFAMSGNADMCRLLLEKSWDVARRNREGKTALESAVENYHVRASKVLVEAGSPMRSNESTIFGRLLKKRNRRKTTLFIEKYERFLFLIERELERDEIFAALFIKEMQSSLGIPDDENRRSIEKILAKLSLAKLENISQTKENPLPETSEKISGKKGSEKLKGKYRENLSSVDDFLREKRMDPD